MLVWFFYIAEDSTTSLPITNGDVNVSRAKMPATKQKIWMLSVTMLLLYITLGTGAAQLTNLAFSDPNLHFKAPYLFTMIKMVFRAQALTFYLVGNTFIKVLRKRKLNITKTWRYTSKASQKWNHLYTKPIYRPDWNYEVYSVVLLLTLVTQSKLGRYVSPWSIAAMEA